MRLHYSEACTDLPPAFKAVEEISAMLEAAVLRVDSLTDTGANYFTSDFDDELSELDKFRVEVAQLREAMMMAFLEALKAEVEAGHFEIFGAAGFVPFLTSDEVITYTSEAFRDATVFEALLREIKRRSINFTALMVKFGNVFTTAQVDQIWDAFKISLENDGLDWLVFGNFQDSKVESSSGISWEASLYAAPFMDSPNISAKALAEASYLTLTSLAPNVNDLEDDLESKYELGIDALAAAVSTFNRPFFVSSVKENKIDPEVAKILLPSWRGSFGSFLVSARYLSADLAPSKSS